MGTVKKLPPKGQILTRGNSQKLPPKGQILTHGNSQKSNFDTWEQSKTTPEGSNILTRGNSQKLPPKGQILTRGNSQKLPPKGQILTRGNNQKPPPKGQILTRGNSQEASKENVLEQLSKVYTVSRDDQVMNCSQNVLVENDCIFVIYIYMIISLQKIRLVAGLLDDIFPSQRMDSSLC